jgi:serine phosphatase RsbU (regulator of sigma subunit)
MVNGGTDAATDLDIARALAEQREINGRLQQVIMPADAPVIDVNGMRVAVRCLGADHALHVGGDWYLTMPLPDGDLLLAVGDAVGHGLSAATAMVQLRHAMSAFAAEGHSPRGILAALNALLCQQDAETIATAVVARYRPGTGELTWARAGHPPILLAGARGVHPLGQPAGVVLGAFPEAEYRHAQRRLRSGDLVLMYTDGFVERRGGTIDEGVSAFSERVGAALTARSSDRPTAVVDRLDPHNPTDDACVLVAERLP